MCDVRNTENLSNIQFIDQMVQSDNTRTTKLDGPHSEGTCQI